MQEGEMVRLAPKMCTGNTWVTTNGYLWIVTDLDAIPDIDVVPYIRCRSLATGNLGLFLRDEIETIEEQPHA
jgi:hypothetical protein